MRWVTTPCRKILLSNGNMTVQRYYLKLGHVDVRVLPVVITTVKDGWFKKLHLQEFVALVSVNSKLLLNFRSHEESILDGATKDGDNESSDATPRIVGKNISFSYCLRENVPNNKLYNNNKINEGKICQLNTGDGGENVVSVHKILGYTLHCTLYDNSKNVVNTSN